MRCGPQVFVVTILLLGFMDMIDIGKNSFEVLEIYAGEQRLVKLAKGLDLVSPQLPWTKPLIPLVTTEPRTTLWI